MFLETREENDILGCPLCVLQTKPVCPLQESLACVTASCVKSSRSAIANNYTLVLSVGSNREVRG